MPVYNITDESRKALGLSKPPPPYILLPYERENIVSLIDFLKDKNISLLPTNTDLKPVPVCVDTFRKYSNQFLDNILDSDPKSVDYFIHNIVSFEKCLHSLPFKMHSPFYRFMIKLSSTNIPEAMYIYEYILDHVRKIYPERKPSSHTINNILRFNKTIIMSIPPFKQFIESRPPNELCEEQMFSLPESVTSFFTTAKGTASELTETSEVIKKAIPSLIHSADKIAEFNETVPHLRRTLDSLTTFAQVSEGKVADTLDSVAKFAQQGTSTLNKLSPIVSNIAEVRESSLLENFKKNWIGISASMTGIYTSKNFTEFSLHLIPIVTMLGLDSAVIDYFKTFFANRCETQDGFDKTKQLMCLLFTFMGKYTPSTLLSKSGKYLNDSMKEVEAMEKLWELIAELLSEFGIDVSSKAKLISSLRKDLVEILECTAEFETLVATKTSVFTRDKKYNEFMIAYKKVQDLKIAVDTGCYTKIKNSNFCADLMSLSNRYIKMKRIIDEVRATSGRRQETFAINLLGPSGIGKSRLMTEIPARLKKRIRDNDMYYNILEDGTREIKEEYEFISDIADWSIWNHNVVDDYHQGYNGQEIHVIDDLFSKTDEKDHGDILNFISPVTFPTRQAELSQKGFPYTSKLMLTSANKFPCTSKELKCVEALQRRFTVIRCESIGPVPKPTVENPDPSPDFTHLKMTVIEGRKANDTKISGRVITIDELCHLIVESIRIRHIDFEISQQKDEEVSEFFDTFDFGWRRNPKPNRFVNILEERCLVIDTEDIKPFWNSVKNFNSQIYKNLVKRQAVHPMTGEMCYIREFRMQAFQHYKSQHPDEVFTRDDEVNYDEYFNVSSNIFPYMAEGGFAISSRNDIMYTVLCKFPDSNWYAYRNGENKMFKISNQSDFSCYATNYYIYDEEADPSILVQTKVWMKKVWKQFGPVIKLAAGLGTVVGMFVSPLYTYIISCISIILLTLKSKNLINPELFHVLDMINDLLAMAPYIPAIVMLISTVIYKLKSFKMLSPCIKCSQTTPQLREFHNIFCEVFCRHLKAGDHSETCLEFPMYVSFIYKDQCPCDNEPCPEECCHNLPLKSVDPKKLAYYTMWVREWEEAASEEVSPTGLKQAKVKRHFKQEGCEEVSPTGLKQAKVKRAMREVSFTGVKQSKIHRKVAEACFDGTNQKKVNKPFRPSNEINIESKLTKDKLLTFLETPEEEYGGVDGHSPGSQQIRKKINIAFEERSELVLCEEQMTLDEASRNLAHKLAKQTIQCFRVKQDGSLVGFLHGNPFGKYIVTPAHLYAPSSNCSYQFRLKEINYPMQLVNIDTKRDIALWTFTDKTIPVFNMAFYQNLITESEYLQLANIRTPALQYIPCVDAIQIVQCEPVTHQTIAFKNGNHKEYDRLLTVNAAVTFPPTTTKGDCGGIIVAFNTKYPRKVFGMHIIGAMDVAYSAILTKEQIDKMMKVAASEEMDILEIEQPYSEFKVVDIQNLVPNEVVGCRSTNLPEGEFAYIGESDIFSRPSAKTSIKKHPLHGVFPVTNAPALLHPSEVEDKALLDIDGEGKPNLVITRAKKYGKKFVNTPDQCILDNMEENLKQYYLDNFEGLDLSPSSMYDILNGDPEEPDSHPLDLRTSPGIPWSGGNNGHAFKKSHYIKMSTKVDRGMQIEYRELDMSKPMVHKLIEIMDKTEELAKQKIRTVSLIKTCLKDEPRPLGKEHKPRVFMAFPLDKVLLTRKYFLKFKTEWTKMRGQMFHSVGINVTSPEWAQLYHDLRYISPVGMDADFGTFDGNLRPEFMKIARNIIVNTVVQSMCNNNQFLDYNLDKDEITNIMNVLFDENISTISVIGKTVYMDSHGNPSGSVLTTITNCIVNMLYHWYAYIRITGHQGLGKFIENVCMRCFGDDVIITVDPSLGYTFEAISKIMIEELEQDYTDASKTLAGSMKPIEELSFLKRKFKVISPSIILSPIEKDSIQQRFNWTQIEDTDYETHFENVREALIEACQHGTEYFKEFKGELRRGIRVSSFNRIPKFKCLNPSYSDCYAELLDRYT